MHVFATVVTKSLRQFGVREQVPDSVTQVIFFNWAKDWTR